MNSLRWGMSFASLSIVFVCVVPKDSIWAQESPTVPSGTLSSQTQEKAASEVAPILCLNTGGHTARATQVFFTHSGRELISVGEDKVVRVWYVATGETTRILRGDVGAGTVGSIFTAALSPDGQTLAVDAGYFGRIRLCDFRTGQVSRVLRGHNGFILALAFSPDGSRLASGSADHTVRIWNVTTGECEKVLRGHGGEAYDVAFSPEGSHLASASSDHTVRIWDMANGECVRILKAHTDEVRCVAWSPNGRIIASGSSDHTILLWDAVAGKPGMTLPLDKAACVSLAFSHDGRFLAAGLTGGIIRAWLTLKGSLVREFSGGDRSVVMSVAASPDERLVASSHYSGVICLWDIATGAIRRRLEGTGSSTLAVAWSSEGQRLHWKNAPAGEDPQKREQPLERSFDLASATPGNRATAGERWIPAVTQSGGRTLSYTEDRKGVILRESGREVCRFPEKTRDSNDDVCCFTLTPAGEVVVGSQFALALYDASGKPLRRFWGHLGGVNAVSVSPDGRYLASASSDQTVRVWALHGDPYVGIQDEDKEGFVRVVSVLRGTPGEAAGIKAGDLIASVEGAAITTQEGLLQTLRSRKPGDRVVIKVRRGGAVIELPTILGDRPRALPLLSIFWGKDEEWVAWTPKGYYTCSPKGERLIGWQVNRGFDKAADYYPAYQFRRRFFRPDIVGPLLGTGSESEAIRLADAGRHQTTDAAITAEHIEQFAPPKIEILGPTEGSAISGAEVTVKARITDPNKRKISSVTLLVNGRRTEPRGISVEATRVEEGVWSRRTGLIPGENTLTLTAVNDAGAESSPVSVKVTCQTPETEVEKPVLYLMTIGVSKYQQQELSLKFSSKDATDLAAAYKEQEGKMFRKVVCKELTDSHATRGEILDTLDWLSRQVTQRDWALVFVSGHGVPDNQNNFYYLPADGDPDHLKSTGVKWSDFTTTLTSLPGKVLLVLDTCHAGGATGTRTRGLDTAYSEVLRDANTDEAGLITLASCMPRESSLERDEWGNGAFTKALIEGLKGKADSNGDGVITIAELDAYVADRVKELTDGAQHPTTQRPTTIRSSLPLAFVK